jgi:hypothetical protein
MASGDQNPLASAANSGLVDKHPEPGSVATEHNKKTPRGVFRPK